MSPNLSLKLTLVAFCHGLPGSMSAVPMAVPRFKALVGVKLTAQTFKNQRGEAHVKCRVLIRMAALGRPLSERVPQD